MNRIRFLMCLLFFLCSPAFSSEEQFDLNAGCEDLVRSLEEMTPAADPVAVFRRRHSFIPWAGVIEEIIETGQAVDPSTAREIAARLERLEKILVQNHTVSMKLPSRLRDRLVSSAARATSAYYSYLDIPHTIEISTNAVGGKFWRLNVRPQSPATTLLAEVANRLSSADTVLGIDFELGHLVNGVAAFVEGSEMTPAPGAAPRSRFILPFRMAYRPGAVASSLDVLEELRHLENSLRKLRGQDFPFYGTVFFSAGLEEIFYREPERSSSFVRNHERHFSLDENDTLVEKYFNMNRLLDDPLADFNSEMSDVTLEGEFKLDTQNLTMAHKLSVAIGQAVLVQLDRPSSGGKIEFFQKSGLVWARVNSALSGESTDSRFVLVVPLVRAKAGDSDEEKLRILRIQMAFMLNDLQNRSRFIDWLHTSDQLRHGLEFESKSYKDFLRVYLSALVHPGFSNQHDFLPLTWDRQSRAYRQATFKHRRR